MAPADYPDLDTLAHLLLPCCASSYWHARRKPDSSGPRKPRHTQYFGVFKKTLHTVLLNNICLCPSFFNPF